MNEKCEYFPEEGPVCYAGSDIAGPFKCTKQYSLMCQWANDRRIKLDAFGREVTEQIKPSKRKEREDKRNYRLSFTFLTKQSIKDMSDDVLNYTIKLLTDIQPSDPMLEQCIKEKEKRKVNYTNT